MSIPVYSSEQMQQWDAFTIGTEPIKSIDLMERAASLATKAILGRNLFEKAAIFCGPGNNGGDGLVIARLLAEAEKKVEVFVLKFAEESEDFKTNYKRLPKHVKITELTEKNSKINCDVELLIDAVFGSGLNRPIQGWIANVIEQMNAINCRKIAIDMPSGLYSTNNDQNNSEAIFKADETLTFMSPKLPFFFEAYAEFVGSFRLIDIGLHPKFKEDVLANFIVPDDIKFSPRTVYDHKGKNGFLTVIGGLGQMTGAAIIAGHAAMKSGAGYVNVACNSEGRTALNTVVPEVIWINAEQFELPKKTTAIALGPGLGTEDLSNELLMQALKSNLPLVLDADAINLIAENKIYQRYLPKNCIMTPHIGELKRLVGDFNSAEELLDKQKEFSKAHGIFIIQKGPFSKLTCPDGTVHINSTGNPGMATAGMGDALTGIIGSFLAQGYTPEDAAKMGMFVHGYAADEQMKNTGVIGLLATDVIQQLPTVINKFVRI